MKWLKNILVVIALFAAAMPCTHADMHPDHSASADVQAEMVESHHCSCHSCEDVVCTEDLEGQQTISVVVTPVAYSATSLVLFVIPETKPVVYQVTSTVADPLIALQTVQLLI